MNTHEAKFYGKVNRLLLMPDIDRDFNTSNIDEFLDFVQKKYGKGVR